MVTSQERKHRYFLPNDDGSPFEKVTESSAVIFVGANGSGKSRLGAWIEQNDTAQVHRIGAQRGLNFSKLIPLTNYEASEDMVVYGNADRPQRSSKIYKYGRLDEDEFVTHQFNDFDHVLSALIAKTTNEEHAFTEQCKEAQGKNEQYPQVPRTEIDKLKSIWQDIFPQRKLIYKDSAFYAEFNSPDREMVDYSATVMSDGERTALYFISQVLCVPKGMTLLIDEPELHMHKSLVNRLWLALEQYRPDCLFIYITHDTQFAALHAHADKYWVKEYYGNARWDIEAITSQELPNDLLLNLLGNRKNVLFVEGESDSLDSRLYSLVYPDYYIVPCGSCTQVIARTKAIGRTDSLHHIKAYGIIDRDYRTDKELEKLRSSNVFCVDIAEVENLFIVEEVIRAVSHNMGCNGDQVMQSVRQYIVETRFRRQINRQICQATVSEIKHQINTIDINGRNDGEVKDALDRGLKGIDYGSVRDDIEAKFQNTLSEGCYRQILRIFNEKKLANTVGTYMGIENKKYCSVVLGMMRNGTIDINETVGIYMPSPNDIPR